MRGIGRFLFEHPAQVVGTGKAAQAGYHVQCVLPVEQQPLGCFNAHRGEVFARRHANGCGKGAHQMALGHAQPFAQLLHAVKARVVCADVLNGGLHQRRQGGRGTVGVRKLTQQCVGQLAAGTAVGGLFLSKAVHQFGSGRAGTALGKEGQFVQSGQKLGSRLPGKLDAEQMADAFRYKGQRGTAQDQVPGSTDCGGKMSAAPSGSGPAAGTDAEHWPLDTRHTHSPSPERVRGADSCRSCTEAGKAMVFQSKSNI